MKSGSACLAWSGAWTLGCGWTGSAEIVVAILPSGGKAFHGHHGLGGIDKHGQNAGEHKNAGANQEHALVILVADDHVEDDRRQGGPKIAEHVAPAQDRADVFAADVN